MKKLVLFAFLGLFVECLFAQPVEVDLFQMSATSNTAQIGIRVRATGADVNYMGVTFYILHDTTLAKSQSTSANSVVGVDDSKMVTEFNWTSGARFTNPRQGIAVIDPGAVGGPTYNARYVYGNADDAGGANVQTLISSRWDTLLYITFDTYGLTSPEGGYAYLQSTAEAAGAALTDPMFANVAFIVNSGDVPLGLSVLPVTFTDYFVNCTDKGTLVSWKTGSEMNSSHFEIQKNSNGSWSTIGNVAAAGNSSTSRSYTYFDMLGGAAQYRIKQVDQDGRFEYSEVRQVDCQSRNVKAFIFPVPARDVLNVRIQSDYSLTTELQVYDMSGKVVKRQPANLSSGTNTVTLNIGNLGSGEYIIRSSNPAMQLNQKFSVIR